MRRVLEALGSGMMVYALVAACSASGSGTKTAMTGGAGGASSGGAGGVAVGGAAGATGAGGSGGIIDAAVDALDAIADVLTDPVPDATANESGTRLRARRWVGSDGSKHFIGWRDTLRKEDCTFQPAEDGAIRCIPMNPTGAIYFSDASCSSPLFYPSAPMACPPKTMYRTTTSNAACGPVAAFVIYSIGQQVSAPTDMYSLSGTTCSKVAPPAGVQFFTATHLQPTEFVSATEQID